MPKEAKEHPTLTEIQVELWLANTVTKTFIQCMEFKRQDIRDQAGSGAIVDSSSADLTHALLHRALGQQDLCSELAEPARILEFYAMIEHPEEETENE